MGLGPVGELPSSSSAGSVISWPSGWLCPACPWCGSPPRLVMGGGTQAVCENVGCNALLWNPSVTAAANLAKVHQVELGEPSASAPERGGD